MSVILAEGIYAVIETAVFKPANRSFTKAERLTIRVEVLPNDPTWSTQCMPMFSRTMPLSPTWMGRTEPYVGVSYGLQFEASHVTVQGLKILGTTHRSIRPPRPSGACIR